MAGDRQAEPMLDIFQVLTSVARSDDKTMAPLAKWVLDHQDECRRLTISDLAIRTEVSETTIFRFCKLLGLTGYKDLRLALAEGRGLALGSQMAGASEEAHDHSYGGILQKVIEANIEQLMRTPTVLSLDALEQATERLLNAAQIQIVGFGSSAPIAIDACRRLLSLGLPAMAHSDPHILAVVTAQSKPGTVFLGISCSGRTRDLIDAFETAGEKGLDRILITSDPASPATKVADLILVSAVRRMPPALDILGTRISQLAIIEAISVALSQQDPEAHAILRDTRPLEREIAKKRTREQTD